VVREAIRRRARGVLFGGGEPTMHPRIEALVADTRQRGLGVGLISNGVRLGQDAEFRSSLIASGLGRVHIHLFSSDTAMHDTIGGGNASLEASLDAAEGLVRADVEVLVVVPVFAQNLEGIPALMNHLADRHVAQVHFTVPEFVEDPWSHAPQLEVAAYVREALMDERFARASFDRLPLCMMQDRLPFYLRITHRDPVNRRHESRESLSWLCRDCAASPSCEASRGTAMSLDDAAHLAPFLTTVGNSFNYVPRQVVAEISSLEECPLRDAKVPLPALNPERDLLIYPSQRLMVVGSDSADFDEGEIRRVRQELGQVYLDISDKILLDDFENDLAILRKDESCTQCPRLGDCPGAYSIGQVREGFRESQARLESILMELRGRVLDVGVGEPHSLAKIFARWGEKDESGTPRVRYVGIEPEIRRIKELHVRYSELDIRQFGAESPGLGLELGAPDDLFDHVLLLRSYNHLTDLYLAFSNLVGLLKPGGTMVVVDNTAFGLVRSRKKIKDLRGCELEGQAPFEHYRNHGSDEALKVLMPFGLTLVEHHPVRADTANQWILVMKKVGEAEEATEKPS